MSYFNDEQQKHMEALGRIPPEERCYSGWHRLGSAECISCGPGTCADRKADIDASMAAARAHNATTKHSVWSNDCGAYCRDCSWRMRRER